MKDHIKTIKNEDGASPRFDKNFLTIKDEMKKPVWHRIMNEATPGILNDSVWHKKVEDSLETRLK